MGEVELNYLRRLKRKKAIKKLLKIAVCPWCSFQERVPKTFSSVCKNPYHDLHDLLQEIKEISAVVEEKEKAND